LLEPLQDPEDLLLTQTPTLVLPRRTRVAQALRASLVFAAAAGLVATAVDWRARAPRSEASAAAHDAAGHVVKAWGAAEQEQLARAVGASEPADLKPAPPPPWDAEVVERQAAEDQHPAADDAKHEASRSGPARASSVPLRKLPVQLSATARGSCKDIPCFGRHVPEAPCQCNTKCDKFSDCCDDFRSVCFEPGDSVAQDVQNRKLPVQLPEARGSCRDINCFGLHKPDAPCQCNSQCETFRDCCDDYESVCLGPEHERKLPVHLQPQSEAKASCKEVPCWGRFQRDALCQCNALCEKFGNCCDDFQSVCKSHRVSHARAPKEPHPRTTAPSTTTAPTTTTTTTTTSTTGKPHGVSFCREAVVQDGFTAWEFAKEGVPIHSAMTRDSKILAHRSACDIFAGKQIGQFWIKLLCESGYVRIGDPEDPAVVQRTIQYKRLQEGEVCNDPLLPIDSLAVCTEASAELGVLPGDGEVLSVTDNSGPAGCYIAEVSSSLYKPVMVFNTRKPESDTAAGQAICTTARETCTPPPPTTTTTILTTTANTTTTEPTTSTGTGSTSTQTRTSSTSTHTTSTVTTIWVPATSASLFCFSVTRTTGYERDLISAQYEKQVSIFGCEDWLVLSTGGELQVGDTKSIQIDGTKDAGKGDMSNADDTTNSWLNTEIFMKAWELVIDDGRFRHHDWVVKVDPDTVFFPSRLRAHMVPLTPKHGSQQKFIGNCNRVFDASREKFKVKLFGSLEIFSRGAIEAYEDGAKHCKSALKWQGWGEDYWMQACLLELKVAQLDDMTVLGDSRCYPAPCADSTKVAFHDYKDTTSYFACWGESLGPAAVAAHLRHVHEERAVADAEGPSAKVSL